MVPTKKLGKTGLEVSRIGLGTTEIGFVYGLGNPTVPSRDEAIEFLKYAVDIGVTFIDTARFYGDVENYIGASGIMNQEGVVVLTKCGHVLDRAEDIPTTELISELRAELDQSRRNLRVDTLPLVLFHGASAKLINNGTLPEIIERFKKEGIVRFMGASTRGEETPLVAIESGVFDALEIGFSILDQRMSSKVLPVAEKAGIGVINRSVFLKGVLTPAGEKLPDSLAPLKKGRLKAEKIAQKIGTDLPSLAMRFALSQENIDVSLVGTSKRSHLESATTAAQAGKLSPDIIKELESLAIEDISQVDPAHWPPETVADSKGGKKILPHFYNTTKDAPK